jgi:hypothetical protein
VNGADRVPVGIVTNENFVSAYKRGLTLDHHAVKEIMSKDLQTCDINISREGAAAIYSKETRPTMPLLWMETNTFKD